MEEWRDIKGFEGLYQVSSEGRVRSIDRYDKSNRFHKGKILSQSLDNKGYPMVRLWKDNKCYSRKMNNVIKSAFFENYEGLTIDHIDTDKSNNRLSNLRLVDMTTNIRNPLTQEHFRSRNYKRVVVNLTTNKEYKNARYAHEDTGVNKCHICECCRGVRKSAGGYKWIYKEIA